MFPPISWIQYRSVKTNEQVWDSFAAIVPEGVMYREVIRYIDQANGSTKASTESMCFVAQGSGPLTWLQSSDTTFGGVRTVVYQATVPAGHVYLNIISEVDKASGYTNAVESSMGYANPSIGALDTGITSLTTDVTASGPGAAAATISVGAVTLAKMASLSANSVVGNNTGTPATPSALTQAQLTAMLNQFTSLLQGAVPASGGGTSNFLRADGNWTAPPSGGGSSILTADVLLTGDQIRAAGTVPAVIIPAVPGKQIILLSCSAQVTPDGAAYPGNQFTATNPIQELLIGDPSYYEEQNSSFSLQLSGLNNSLHYPANWWTNLLVQGVVSQNSQNLGSVTSLQLFMSETATQGHFGNSHNGGLTGGGNTTLRIVSSYILVSA